MEIATRSKTQAKRNNRATYVLVPGGWHGSWCWKRVRKALQDAGHEVFTHNRILNWNALRLLNGFELVLILLFLVRANQLCQTTLNDFDLLRP